MLIHFYYPQALIWLWLVPVVAGLFAFAAVKRRKALKAFGSHTATISRKREAVGTCAALALIVFALARPAWNLQEQQLKESGRDVVFVLDVSRSMLGEDMHPNRLENAKIAIRDCVESLTGDRIGLVIFAGSAEIRCPLTVDYDYFRMALNQVSPDSVSVGGTMIGNAIEKTINKLLKPEQAGLQDLILITDGEDLVEGTDEVEAARLLSDVGARLIAIGIGDRAKGSRIAQTDEETGISTFMKHDNREVWTKLQADTLRRMAAAVPGGTYFEVAAGPFDLKQIYGQVMLNAERTAMDKQTMNVYEEKFGLFLGLSLAALLLSTRWRKTSALHLLALMLFIAGSASAERVSTLMKQGTKAYVAADYEGARAAYQQAADAEPESAELHYNLGTALYKLGHFMEAQMAFEMAAEMAESPKLQRQSLYNLGNTLVKTAESLREEDPYSAVEYCHQAAYYYYAALQGDAAFADAAYNLEICRMMSEQIQVEIKKQEEQQQQENELIKYIREKLEELIAAQDQLIKQTSEKTWKLAATHQRTIEKQTRALIKVMEETELHKPISMPDVPPMEGPLQKTYEHTFNAAEAMKRVIEGRSLAGVSSEQQTARAELIAALGAVPEDPNKQDGESDEESDENDSDMDYEESDEEADMYEEADPFGDFSEYEEIRGVPPPNKTEMDILTEELENQERRKEKKAGSYKPVDKDW